MAIRLKAEYWKKPIPIRDYDWLVVTDDYDGPGSPIGVGRYYDEALSDIAEILLEFETDLQAECMCPVCRGTGEIEVAHPAYGSPSCPSPTVEIACPECEGQGEIIADLEDLAKKRYNTN